MNSKVRNAVLVFAPLLIILSMISITSTSHPRGVTGPTGRAGSIGAIGLIGDQGPVGEAGRRGPIGAQGPRGATGARGPVGPAAEVPGTGSGSFDSVFALIHARRVVEDIGVLDERSADGIGMATRLTMLSGDYDGLASDGVPPGLDPAAYMARVTTLRSFADMAATEFENGDFMNGQARYQVIRNNTGPLLSDLSRALGVTLKFP